MDPIEVPADLTGVEADALTELALRISTRATELSADVNEANVLELERLGDEYERIEAEFARRRTAAEAEAEEAENTETEVSDEELASRAAAAASRFATVGGGDGGGAGAGLADGEEVDTPEVVIAPGTSADVATMASAMQALVAQISANGLVGKTELNLSIPTEELATGAGVITRVQPRGSELAAKLQGLVTDHQGEALTPTGPVAEFKATSFATGMERDEVLDIEKLAASMTKRRHSFSNIPSGVHEDKMTIATATQHWDNEMFLSTDRERNYSIIRNLRNTVEALVASGGACAPGAPSYDIFRTAVPHSPIEGNLPVLGAPRGTVIYIPQRDYTEPRSGITKITNAEDITGTTKNVVRVECPDTDERTVGAVSQIMEFGNLMYRVFPELVADFIADMAVNFASVKEVFYLDQIDAGSIATTQTQVYSLTRNLLRTIDQAAVGYRLRNGMNVDSVLDWYVPVWAVEAIKVDLIADAALGMNFLNASISQVTAQLRSFLSLNVIWTYDGPTSATTQGFRAAQSSGALNAFPTTLISWLHAPGVFARLDGGTLDLGLVRDSVLNGTNDLQLFSEQWIEVIKPGAESLKITISGFKPTGAAPTGATILT